MPTLQYNLKVIIMKKIAMILGLVTVMLSCKNTDKQGIANDDIHQTTIDSMKMVAEKQRIIDSMTIVNKSQLQQKEVVVVHENQNNNATATAPTPVKKKWSGAAKGAVLGAGVGAATGAIVSKKKGQGAIIGGLAGAGVGAGTGAIIDGKKK